MARGPPACGAAAAMGTAAPADGAATAGAAGPARRTTVTAPRKRTARKRTARKRTARRRTATRQKARRRTATRQKARRRTATSTCQQALWRAATVGNGRSARCGQRGWVWKARTWVTPWLPGLRLRPVPRRRREAGDVAPLPWRLNGARVVVPPDKSHRPVRWNSPDHGAAGQRRTRPSAATTAGDLDAFRPGAFPSLVQDLPGLRPFAGQPEVAPAHPSALPGDGGWPCGEQVDGEGGSRSRRKWLPQPTTPDQAARW